MGLGVCGFFLSDLPVQYVKREKTIQSSLESTPGMEKIPDLLATSAEPIPNGPSERFIAGRRTEQGPNFRRLRQILARSQRKSPDRYPIRKGIPCQEGQNFLERLFSAEASEA